MTQTIDVSQTQPAPPPPVAQPMSIMDRILIASELGGSLEEARAITGQLRQFARLIYGEGSWEVGAPIPGNTNLTILAAFNTDFISEDTDGLDRIAGDCRFYAIPTNGITDPLAPVFCCFTLNRSFPAAGGEQMTLETFVREVGREWYNLALVQGVIEEEDEEEEED